MKELTLADHQRLGLEIIKEVDNWCTRNKVRYTLCGGTLIGAIRHQGFIPWDDDIDIAMPRPDYNRFVKEFSHPDLICVAPELGNSLISYGRVCDTKKTYSIPYCPWSTMDKLGKWIDIFPIDGEPEDMEEFGALMQDIVKRQAKLYQIRGSKLPITLSLGLTRIAKNIGKRILYGHYNLQAELDQLLKIIKKIGYGETNYNGNLSYPTYRTKERSRTEIFESYIRVKFEDTELSVSEHYDEYLRDVFGDYMRLPPEEERAPKHSEHRFFFK